MHIIHNSKGSKECILKSSFSYSYPLDSQCPSERHPLLTSFCVSFQSYVTYIGIFLQINFGFFILAFFIVYILEIASHHYLESCVILFKLHSNLLYDYTKIYSTPFPVVGHQAFFQIC